MTRRAPLLLTLVALLPACNDHRLPTQASDSDESQFAQTTTAANPGFTFLAPLAQPASLTGEFNASLPVSIDICSGTGPCTGAARIAEFTTTSGPGAQRIRVDEDGQSYIVNWNTQQFNLTANTVYRIRARVGTVVLGTADVLLVKNQSELRRARSNQVGVVMGQTLPIRFRVAKGVIDAEVVGSSGGTVETSDGTLSLQFPTGALDGETTITVEPLSDAPGPNNRVIGGTAFEFGPSGTTFAQPVTISIRYDAAALPQGVAATLLRVHRWENNTWVPLPGGSVDPQTRKVSAPTLRFSRYALLPAAFASVSSGELHACALTSGGEAWCWGANNAGQLGNRATADSDIAVKVQTDVEFQSIEAGNGHTCGVTTAGEAWCWGANGSGQLGNGTTTASTVPVRVNSAQTFVSISAEFQQTCGLTSNGEVHCWGSNRHGVLGVQTTETCGTQPCSTTPVRVSALPMVADVDVGLGHACARTSRGRAFCWGWNSFGQIGTGTTSAAPQPVTEVLGTYSSISAGALHTCGIDDRGNASCWGSGFRFGAIGDGTDQDRYAPTPVAGAERFKQIDATNGNNIFTHSCGVNDVGRVFCWGANSEGQLGTQANAPQQCTFTSGSFSREFDCAFAPHRITSELTFASVTAGNSFTCGYTTGGDVYCWGWNNRGQLGNDTRTSSRTPVRIKTKE